MAVVRSPTRLSRIKPEELKELFGLSDLPASYKDLDPRNLPPEDLEEFSYDGLGFEEAAGQLWRHLRLMHFHAGRYNRHSQWFPTACAQLEKDIRNAGSFCLTKAVLEQKGFNFPQLEKMNIESLFGLTSFYFRKCGKAFDDLYITTGLISLPMHAWEMRWYQLGERLKATQKKIQKVLDGKLDFESIIEHADMYNRGNPLSAEREIKQPEPLRVRPKALPLAGTYAQQMIGELLIEGNHEILSHKLSAVYEKEITGQQAEDNKEQEQARKQQEKAARKAKNGSSGTGSAKPAEAREETEAETTPSRTEKELKEIGMTLTELRAALADRAEKRADVSELMQILGDPPERLLERWKRIRNEEKKSSSPNPVRKRKRKKR